MKKVCLFMSAFLFCAVFSFAQPKQAVDTLSNAESNIKDISAEKDKTFPQFKSNLSAYVQQQNDSVKDVPGIINLDIRDAFIQFCLDTDRVHGYDYYIIMANYLEKIAKEKGIFKGNISFMDGKQFAAKYKGVDQYDFYTRGWFVKPAFHKVNGVTDTSVVKFVQLIMFTDGLPAVSISFIGHARRSGDVVNVHTWEYGEKMIDDVLKLGLWSTNTAGEYDDGAYAALEEQLIKAGAPFNRDYSSFSLY
ncbi:MAG: hypothetical protein FWF35_05845 [Elusimicrobia bacterium]|nr:hypothetical protein [Elusimicrobiota bacterium]